MFINMAKKNCCLISLAIRVEALIFSKIRTIATRDIQSNFGGPIRRLEFVFEILQRLINWEQAKKEGMHGIAS